MSETKHTPGPWGLTDDGQWLQGDGGKSPLVGEHYFSICVTATSDADKALIAAAPDLLSASEALIMAWGKLAEVLPQDDRIEGLEFSEFMGLRSAVAKARGINTHELSKFLAQNSLGRS